MMDPDSRIEQIIKETRIAFIAECKMKMAEIEGATAQEPVDEIQYGHLLKTVYQHVHSMKGIALTLSYHQIDHSCQKIIQLILQPREREWATAEKNQLQAWINELRNAIHL